MKKVIKLTEADLTRIVIRVIKENETIKEFEDEGFLRDADKYGMEEDEPLGSTDEGEEKLQDLIEEARDILENELGFSIDEINEMSEWDIIDILYNEGYDEISHKMDELLDQEGFDK